MSSTIEGKTMTMKIEGEPMKPWEVWRINHNGEQIERIAQADTREKLQYKPRADWRYGIYHNRQRVE
jgi:hypothetical protein